VRQAILGHLQQGGAPSPFDRIFATRLAVRCIDFLEDQVTRGESSGVAIGLVQGDIRLTSLDEVPRLMDYEHSRPKTQWWMNLRSIARVLARPSAGTRGEGYRG